MRTFTFTATAFLTLAATLPHAEAHNRASIRSQPRILQDSDDPPARSRRKREPQRNFRGQTPGRSERSPDSPGLFALLFARDFSSATGSDGTSPGTETDRPSPPRSWLTGGSIRESIRTTAYTHSEADHLAYGRRNAIGSTLCASRDYTSAAADWSRFPLGTRFRIVGDSTIYVIDDYGSALVGTDTIDLYFTTQGEMNRWGVRHVDIEIIEKGSFERSARHLEGALDYWHCREMSEAIRS